MALQHGNAKCIVNKLQFLMMSNIEKVAELRVLTIAMSETLFTASDSALPEEYTPPPEPDESVHMDTDEQSCESIVVDRKRKKILSGKSIS